MRLGSYMTERRKGKKKRMDEGMDKIDDWIEKQKICERMNQFTAFPVQGVQWL